MALQYPFVNGVLYDYASARIKLKGQIYTGISSINFDDTVERGYLQGTSQLPLGDTDGTYKAAASMEMGMQEHFDLLAGLGDKYMNQRFDVEVQFSATGGQTHTVEIVGCKINKIGNAHQAGPDPLKVSFDLGVMYIKRDGKMPVAQPPAQAR